MIAEAVSLRPTLAPSACPGSGPLPAAIPPLVATLRQLGEAVKDMTDEQYKRKQVGYVSGSVGGHIRHCIDHVAALLSGFERGEIDYDRRLRGTEIEISREAAVEALRRLEVGLLAFPADSEARPLRLSAMTAVNLPAVEVATTVGRELAFVLSHTVHHNALIAVMALTLGVPVPERFGYAPSTIAHLEGAACVR